MRGNQETKATIVVEVLSNGVGAYIARKPTQDLRDESVEKISISKSIEHDFLPDLIRRNHLLIYAVGF